MSQFNELCHSISSQLYSPTADLPDYYKRLYHLVSNFITTADANVSGYEQIPKYDPEIYSSNEVIVSFDTEADGEKTGTGVNSADCQLNNMIAVGFAGVVKMLDDRIVLISLHRYSMHYSQNAPHPGPLVPNRFNNPFWENNKGVWNDLCRMQRTREECIADINRWVSVMRDNGWRPVLTGWPLAYDFSQLTQLFFGCGKPNPFGFGGTAQTKCIGQFLIPVCESFGVTTIPGAKGPETFPNVIKKNCLKFLTDGLDTGSRTTVTHAMLSDATDQLFVFLAIQCLYTEFCKCDNKMDPYALTIKDSFKMITGAILRN